MSGRRLRPHPARRRGGVPVMAALALAALTTLQARSSSLARLHSFAAGHRAADATVEFGVRLIRQALGLPPPSES